MRNKTCRCSNLKTPTRSARQRRNHGGRRNMSSTPGDLSTPNESRYPIPVHSQAFGVRSAAGAEPGTQLKNESVDAYAGLEGLIRLLSICSTRKRQGDQCSAANSRSRRSGNYGHLLRSGTTQTTADARSITDFGQAACARFKLWRWRRPYHARDARDAADRSAVPKREQS